MIVHAVLIETVSIQRYVFGSNKLKENLGASYLIQQIYEDHLRATVKKVLPSVNDNVFDEWRKQPHVILINNGAEFEVGYIGGGNALLFFRNDNKAKAFIENWTKELLVIAPGIVTAVAIDTFDLDPSMAPSKFQTENQKLFKKLQGNKYKFIPQTVIPRHGITAECSHTGYSMEVWNDKEKPEEQDYVSSAAYAKICASNDATRKLEGEYGSELDGKYCFTDELDKLGQQKGEDSHIAVVHIDGNGMGKRFQKTTSLEKIRKLSDDVAIVTKESFKYLIKKITLQFSEIEDALGYDTDIKKNEYPKCDKTNKKILPLRPIIIGGDDITFVSDGRLGIYFAKIFMEAFEKQEGKDGNQLNLTSCAGVAITKTKYPFYRGYELSEQLCGNAKMVRKKLKDNGDNGSWLDFHISYGGFSGTIDEIRKSHYESPQGNLLFRPYKINSNDERGLETLIKNTKYLYPKNKKFPASKIKELRKVLTLDKDATKTFVNEMNARGLKLPKINGKRYHEDIYQELTRKFVTTPYFDIIEFMELYPSFLLRCKNEEPYN